LLVQSVVRCGERVASWHVSYAKCSKAPRPPSLIVRGPKGFHLGPAFFSQGEPMSVTRENIETALAMAIDDEAVEGDSVKQYEIHAIKHRFNGLLDQLAGEADTGDDEDDIDDVDGDGPIDEEDGKG